MTLFSGVTTVGLSRKIAMIAGALMAYEQRHPEFEPEVVDDILTGKGSISVAYTANGDDDWVTIHRKSDGEQFVFDGSKLRQMFNAMALGANHLFALSITPDQPISVGNTYVETSTGRDGLEQLVHVDERAAVFFECRFDSVLDVIESLLAESVNLSEDVRDYIIAAARKHLFSATRR